jgi:hypothetical protein
LRRLTAEIAEIAALPVQAENAAEWRRLNALKPGRPLVYVWPGQVPWHELNVNDELTLQCRDEFCRQHELRLRRLLYQWRHFPGDMVVDPVYACPKVFHHKGFGIAVDEEISVTDASSDIVGHSYHGQFHGPEDLEKIRAPKVTYDREATEANRARLEALFGDVLPVEVRGPAEFGPGMVDELFTWWGIQQAFLDLTERPDCFHEAMERLTNAHLSLIDQYEELGVFSAGTGSHVTGQGGQAFSDELRQNADGPEPARAADLWGSARAQIFAGVSPAMHEEFSLQYERRLLERFALTYYGCCEPLHLKVGILRRIQNLRKISMSPRAEPETAAKALGTDYVFSWKPNPAVFVGAGWGALEADLRRFFEVAEGCIVEVILKDVSTVEYKPERLWEWAETARRVAHEAGM